MEHAFLLPGEERCVPFRDEKGLSCVDYSYCSLQGALFQCVSHSVEEAQRRCEEWLVGQDRCYRN